MYLSQTEIANFEILKGKIASDSNYLQSIINDDKSSQEKRDMIVGVNYYDGLHDVLDDYPWYPVDGNKQRNHLAANTTIQHQFFTNIVDQCTSYITGNPISVTVKTDDEKGTIANKLNEWLSYDFDDTIPDLLSGAQQKGQEWIHPNVNSRGELQYIITPAEGIIPMYDTSFEKNLLGVARYYTVKELIDGKKEDIQKIEMWDDKEVTFYTQFGDKIVLDTSYPVNPRGHYKIKQTIAGTSKYSYKSWGRVPFVCLPNNSTYKNDLVKIKKLIDAHDRIMSGWGNDLIDLQQAIFVFKGYTGLSEEVKKGYSEIGYLIKNMMSNKGIGVSEDGGVDKLTIDLPYEARERFLKLTKEAIYQLSESVDIYSEQFGTPDSGVALKVKYEPLDQKANRKIRKLKVALRDLMYFVCIYLKESNIMQLNYEDIEFDINKRMITNDVEKINALNVSDISRKLYYKLHPYVENPQEEMEDRAEEKEKAIKDGIRQMNNNNDDSDDDDV